MWSQLRAKVQSVIEINIVVLILILSSPSLLRRHARHAGPVRLSPMTEYSIMAQTMLCITIHNILIYLCHVS
jgi:hypothetical protein